MDFKSINWCKYNINYVKIKLDTGIISQLLASLFQSAIYATQNVKYTLHLVT